MSQVKKLVDRLRGNPAVSDHQKSTSKDAHSHHPDLKPHRHPHDNAVTNGNERWPSSRPQGQSRGMGNHHKGHGQGQGYERASKDKSKDILRGADPNNNTHQYSQFVAVKNEGHQDLNSKTHGSNPQGKEQGSSQLCTCDNQSMTTTHSLICSLHGNYADSRLSNSTKHYSDSALSKSMRNRENMLISRESAVSTNSTDVKTKSGTKSDNKKSDFKKTIEARREGYHLDVKAGPKDGQQTDKGRQSKGAMVQKIRLEGRVNDNAGDDDDDYIRSGECECDCLAVTKKQINGETFHRNHR